MGAPEGNQYAIGNSGRPTGYKPEYCDTAIELGKQGKSPNSIACAIGVARPTLYAWAEKHEEFMTALKIAKQHEQEWWENKGQEGIDADKFNATVWKVSMAARFRDDYTERKETTNTHNVNMVSQEQRDAAVAAATRADS